MLEELNKKYDILAASDQKFIKILNDKIAYNDGKENTRKFMIKNMLKNNIDHKTIAIALGMSEKEAEQIINQTKNRK